MLNEVRAPSELGEMENACRQYVYHLQEERASGLQPASRLSTLFPSEVTVIEAPSTPGEGQFVLLYRRADWALYAVFDHQGRRVSYMSLHPRTWEFPHVWMMAFLPVLLMWMAALVRLAYCQGIVRGAQRCS